MRILHLIFLGSWLVVLGSINGCQHHREIPEGGPCSYNISKEPARIIAIYPSDSTEKFYELFFEVRSTDMPVADRMPLDTLMYTQHFSGYLPADTLRAYNYKVGDSVTYEHQRITSGSCTPEIDVLRMERWK